MRIVDIHEPDSIANELIKAGWDRKHLTVADYTFEAYDGKTVGIERKEANDLLNSLASGRLAKQLQNLLNTYDVPIFLLEGKLGQLQDDSGHSHILLSGGETRWTTEAVRNFLLSWELKGVNMRERTGSISDTIERLKELVVYYSKPLHLGGLNRKVVGDERLLAFPSCVPIKCRESILRNVNSLHNVGNLRVSELQLFDGMGQTRAEAIYNFYHKENK